MKGYISMVSVKQKRSFAILIGKPNLKCELSPDGTVWLTPIYLLTELAAQGSSLCGLIHQ